MPERSGTGDAEASAAKRQRRSKWGPEEGGPADESSLALAVPEGSQFGSFPTYSMMQQQLTTLRQPDQLMQVYVGNLDPFIGEQEIMQIFSAFGAVLSVDMPREGNPPRSRGYCFVEYVDQNIIDKAIAALQDFQLGGQKIKVGRSTKKRTTSAVLPVVAAFAASAGGFASGAAQSLLASPGGLGAAAAVAAAASATPAPAAASNGSPSAPSGAGGGKTSMDTVMATTAAARGDTGTLMERRKTVVTGIPREFATKEVATVFQAFGMVRSCVLLPSTTQPELHCGTAIIEFATENSAKEAVKTMNGFALAGSILSVIQGSTPPPVSAGVVPPALSMNSGRTAADLASEAGRAAGARGNLSLPSRVLVLENLVGAGEADGELSEEVREECSQFGDVNKVTVYECRKDPGVRVFVRFEEEESGSKAAEALNGRWFGGRQVRAWTYGEERYLTGDFDSSVY